MQFPNVNVVGMHFRGPDAKEAAANLEPGQELRLEREGDNPHDFNAIKVFFADLWIGYVERAQAAWIAPNMDEGREFTCVVEEVREVPNARGKVTMTPVVVITAKPDA
ncbi:MAG TPA: HIRAN domain-containing protein [Rhizobium sp.]|nr:HIRAN domain-containing protein [Rhizobium sp.]